ncbi:MAG: metalloendopeptidase [Bdellovibrionota bacterium]
MATNNNLTNDPFEEFEFRPINEGLGFHRKQKNQSTLKTTPYSFAPPLPRNETKYEIKSEIRPEIVSKKSFNVPTIEDDSIAKAQTAVNEILKNLNQKRQIDFINETEKQRLELKKSKPVFFAAVLDSMLITAGFLLSMILMLSITKIDLFMNLNHAETSRFVYIATLSLFLGITFIYMVVNRAFIGCTPGEWAFDQCCGNEKQASSLSYIPRLALRTLVVMATGFVTLPILSYLLNKDIAGQIIGVNLFKKSHA